MMEDRLFLLLLSVLVLPHTGYAHVQKFQTVKCDYVLMGAYSGNPVNDFNFSKTVSYLEETAGKALASLLPQCNGRVTFRFVMYVKKDPQNLDLRAQLVDGSVDFLLTHPLLQVCTSSVGAVPVLSYSRVLDPRLPRPKGMLIIREGMQGKIRGYQDLAEKIIGVPSWPAVLVFFRHAQAMAKHNLHIWQDPAQIAIFGYTIGKTSPMWAALLDGHIDVLFWSTDLLSIMPKGFAENVLAVCNGTFKPVLEAGESMGCTEDRVDNPLLVMKHVPKVVSKAVVQAIISMPGGANHSANIQSKVTAWLPPDDYLSHVKMSRELGAVMEEIAPGERWCSSDLVKSITCPAGYVKKSIPRIVKGCVNVGRECRAVRDQDLQHSLTGCICKPCERQNAKLHPRANISVACSTLKQCMSVVQFSDAYLTLKISGDEDHENHSDFVSYRVSQTGTSVFHGVGVLRNTSADDNDTDQRNLMFFDLSMPTSISGNFLVHVLFDGTPIEDSPVWYTVLPFQCPGFLEEPDENRTCVCATSAVRINGVCQSAVLIFAYVVVPILVIGLAYVVLLVERKSAALVNQIDGNQIMVDDNAKILGMGGDGVVVQAYYRNTKVAIKAAGIFSRQNSPTKADELIALLRLQTKADFSILSFLGGWFSRMISRKGMESSGGRSQTAAQRVHSGRAEQHPGMNTSSVAQIAASQPTQDQESGTWSMSVATLANTIRLKRQKRHLVREIRALSKIRHPCITTIMGVANLHSSTPLLVLEYMEGGNVFDFLHTKPVDINAHTIVRILQDVCYGLEFLHTARPSICHGDIKSRNILLDASQSRAKIADFGLVQTKASKKVVGGTVAYMAPELLTSVGSVTVSSDVYALGILINECLMRQMPYDGLQLNEENLIKIVKGQLRPALPTQGTYAQMTTVLVSQCWSSDVRYRPDVHSVKNALKDLLSSLKGVVLPAPAARLIQD